MAPPPGVRMWYKWGHLYPLKAPSLLSWQVLKGHLFCKLAAVSPIISQEAQRHLRFLGSSAMADAHPVPLSFVSCSQEGHQPQTEAAGTWRGSEDHRSPKAQPFSGEKQHILR